jgi:hypothetical protein
VRKTAQAILAAMMLWLAAGCASEQEQNQQKWQALHNRVRNAPPPTENAQADPH